MTREDRVALRRQRSEAVQRFLDENAALLSPQIGEYENEDELIEEAANGIYITGAVLVIRGRDLATGETEFNLNIGVPFAIGVTEKIGMLDFAIDELR